MARDFILYELLWISPVMAGLASILYISYCHSRYSVTSVVMRCFSLSLLIISIGAFGSWRSGLEIWKLMGAAGNISLDILYSGWKRSWWPLMIAGIAVLPLLGLAIAAISRKGDLPFRRPIDTTVLMCYPAAAVLLLCMTGISLEIIYDPLYSLYTSASLDRWIYQLMSIGVLGYLCLSLFGIPYSIVWGLYLRRWRRTQSNNRLRIFITIFYITFSIIAVAFTVLFTISIVRGVNPYFFY